MHLTRFAAVWLAVLMLVPSGLSGSSGNSTSVFSTGTTSVQLEATPSGTPVRVDLPEGARVVSASLELRGELPVTMHWYSTGNGTCCVAVGDINNDGYLDAVALATQNSVLTAVLNLDGKMTDTTTVTKDTPAQPVALAVGDFLPSEGEEVAVGTSDGHLTVYSSMFGSSTSYQLGGKVMALMAADLNSDSRDDIVYLVKSENPLGMLMSTQSGLTTPQSVSAELGSPVSLAVGDLDADGDPDIAVASENRPYTMHIIYNQGSFSESKALTLSDLPGNLYAAPLLGGPGDDLLLLYRQGNLGIFRHSTFEEVRMNTTLQNAAAVGDIDGDMDTDFITADRANSLVHVWRNINGTFSIVHTHMMGSNPTELVTADMDMDGDLDLLSANVAEGTVGIAYNTGDGRYAWYDAVYMKDVGRITGGDFNGDGEMDIVSSNYGQGTITFVFSTGNGSFGDPVVYDSYRVVSKENISGSEPFYVVPVDVDNDGDLDVVYGEELSYAVIVMRNDGTGHFEQYSAARENGTNLLDAPSYITVPLDFDGDGDLDLIINHINHPYISVLLNDGTGYFRQRLNHSMDGYHPYDYVLRDFDGDGYLGMITANYGLALNYEDTLTVVENRHGKLVNARQIKVDKGPRTIDMGDLNGDGMEDVVVGIAYRTGLMDIGRGYIMVLTAEGAGYSSPSTYVAGVLPGDVHITDLDGDGHSDIICLNQGVGLGGSISIFMNSGDGTFSPQIEIPKVPFGYPVYNDFNHDGRDEMIVPLSDRYVGHFTSLYYPKDVSLAVNNRTVWHQDGLLWEAHSVDLTDALKGEDSVVLRVRANQSGVVSLYSLHVEYEFGEEKGEKEVHWQGQALLMAVLILSMISLGVKRPVPPEEASAHPAAQRKGAEKPKNRSGR